jgi:hypothetical protein
MSARVAFVTGGGRGIGAARPLAPGGVAVVADRDVGGIVVRAAEVEGAVLSRWCRSVFELGAGMSAWVAFVTGGGRGLGVAARRFAVVVAQDAVGGARLGLVAA